MTTPRPNMTFPFPRDMIEEIMGYRPADTEVTLGPGLSYEDLGDITTPNVNLSLPQIATLILWASEEAQVDNEAYPPDEGRPDPLADAIEGGTSGIERFRDIICFLASKARHNPYASDSETKLTLNQKGKVQNEIQLAVAKALLNL